MKCFAVVAVLVAQLATPVSAISLSRSSASSLDHEKRQTPVDRVVTLIVALKDQIEADHSKEQKSYDKFACWCEKTFARKIKDIADGKEFIKKAEARMLELRGEIAVHEAEVKDLKKQIDANKAAQKDATEVRDGEYADYRAERTESEQCIGALEAAINILTPAGTGKGKFLETLQETQLLSVAGDMNRVLQRSQNLHTNSEQDLELVRRFIQHPQEFARRSTGTSALQTQNNPFGDYAPQSTQIQGILKGMYDGFTSDLEKDNAEESEKQKNFVEFIAIKQKELATLEKTLATHETALAKKNKEYAETKKDRNDAVVQLEEDEAFFAATKKNCQDQAINWGDRTRMRTEEINGVLKAIEILTSKEAQEIFKNSTTTFLQIGSSAVTHHQSSRSAVQSAKLRAYSTVSKLAAKYQNLEMANIAVEMKTGGHFDKVQMMIQQMIELLRKEEQEDIDHRDRCEGAENANSNNKEDVEAGIQKTNNALRLNGLDIAEKQREKGMLEGSIKDTKKALKDLLDMRNEEEQEFKDSLKHDTEAIDIIQKAIVAISAFYKNHDIKLELVQKRAPEYTQDNDTAPELNFGDGNYKRDDTGGVVAIMRTIIVDIENEMKEARKTDADAEAEYEADKAALDKTLNGQERSLAQTEKEIGELEEEAADLDAKKTDLGSQKDGLADAQQNLVHDCSWVKTHFQARRDARKLELEGLHSAKAILAGVDAGDWDEVAIQSR